MHRDLKPGNIMVKDGKLLKICDFGCARTFAEVLTAEPRMIQQRFTNQAVGTDLYAAPELSSGDYDEKVDLWSAGCILMEMLSIQKAYCRFH
jgi:cyclin-dependent kinase-like